MLFQSAAQGPNFFFLAPWVVFIPVIGLLFNIIFGGRLPEKVIGVIASTATGLTFVIAVLLGLSLAGHGHEAVIVPVAQWIQVGALNIQWAFQVDTLSVTMMLVVSGVGTLIHIYSIGYMHEDVRHNGDPKRFRRFFVYLNLFIAAMMILVGSDNYMMLFVGWEGVGLCSYLLIGFWYEKGKDGIGNAVAGKKAMVLNRIGDFGFLLAAFTLFWAFGSFNFTQVFEKAPEVAAAAPLVLLFITLAMLLGVTGKSAQIPLYVWLPDAMAGPTPVSALIHAATMVTAGVYLIVRSAPLFNLTPTSQFVVTLVGSLTALFAATIAVGQFDIKKVLAYSTISQLGFMVAAAGIGAYYAAMFHLIAHAFFKGLLFLGSGSVIQGMERGLHNAEHSSEHSEHSEHSNEKSSLEPKEKELQVLDPQDMRNMGGLRKTMKTTFWVYLIGSLALAGVFPFAGFWSKDEILVSELAYKPVLYVILALAAFLTAFYMARQVFLVFFGQPRSAAAAQSTESPRVMTIPLVILAVFSALGGLINLPKLTIFGSIQEITTRWIEHSVEKGYLPEFTLSIGVTSTVVALLGILLGYWLYSRRYQEMLKLPADKRREDPIVALIGPVFTALKNKWWVDELYARVIVNPYINLSRWFADSLDQRYLHDWFHDVVLVGGFNGLTRLLSIRVDLGIIDAIANGIGNLSKRIASGMRRWQTGFVRNYALAVFLGVVIILGYLILR